MTTIDPFVLQAFLTSVFTVVGIATVALLFVEGLYLIAVSLMFSREGLLVRRHERGGPHHSPSSQG